MISTTATTSKWEMTVARQQMSWVSLRVVVLGGGPALRHPGQGLDVPGRDQKIVRATTRHIIVQRLLQLVKRLQCRRRWIAEAQAVRRQERHQRLTA